MKAPRLRTIGSFALAALVLLARPAPGQIDAELAAHVAARRKAMDDPSRPPAEREAVALELAAALDRAAWSATTPASRRAAWSEARSVLDGFSARNKDHPK